MWLVDPWNHLERVPLSAQMRSDFAKFLTQYNQGPIHKSEAELRRLDTITAEDALIEQCGVSREFIRLFVAPHEAAARGLGPDALSGAWYLRMVGRAGDMQRHSFPDGNTGFPRHIVKTLIPEGIRGPHTLEAVCRNRVNFAALDRPENQVRIRLQSTAVGVEHEGEPEKSAFVRVTYTRNGQI